MSHSSFGILRTTGLSVTSEKQLTTIKPDSGSTHGGQVIRIDGNGFPKQISDLTILLGTGQCVIEDDYGTDGEVYCKTPAHSAGTAAIDFQMKEASQNFPSLSYTFSASHSPTVSSISPTNGHKGTVLTISGNLLNNGQARVFIGQQICNVTSATSTSVTCLVPEMKAGAMKLKLSNDHGYSNNNVQFTNDLVVNTVTPLDGSFAGGRKIIVTGKGFGVNSAVTVCKQPCPIVSSTYSAITCLLPVYDTYQAGVTTVENCDLTVDGKLHSSQFVYKDSLTPTLDAVSPRRSGTGGGVSITLTGKNFATDVNNVKVRVGETPCQVSSVSETQIECVTGSTKTTNMAARVVVEITGKGQAVDKDKTSAHFEYIDVWSSPFTWGGNSPPAEGNLIQI